MRIHGEYGTRLYRIWHGMTVRCRNKNAPDYPRYGAKGVKIEWPDYASFSKDMKRSYLLHAKKYGETNTTIDRIIHTGNYSKENCRWTTWEGQGQNRYTNRKFLYKGKTRTIADLARQFGMSRQALRYRLNNGMTPAQAAKLPLSHTNRYAETI